MAPFVSQLTDLARTYPTRSKWVFVPSHAIGRTLGERIALEGASWANLRFVTPLEIAVRMTAPFVLEKGFDLSEDSPGPVVIMRLLLQFAGTRQLFRFAAGPADVGRGSLRHHPQAAPSL